MREYYHQGNTRSIFKRALRELGLGDDYLKWRLAIPTTQRLDLRAGRLSATEYMIICKLLLLDSSVIQLGYNRRTHKVRLAKAASDGTLVLPRTPGLRSMLKEWRQVEKQNRKWEANHYGFRLRWRIRIRRWISIPANLVTRALNQRAARLAIIEDIKNLECHHNREI